MKYIITTKDNERLTFSRVQDSLTALAKLNCGNDWDFVTLCPSKNNIPFVKVWRYYPNITGNSSPPIYIKQSDGLSSFFGITNNGCQCIYLAKCTQVEEHDIDDFSEFIFSNEEMID